jgi:hypothetical protein
MKPALGSGLSTLGSGLLALAVALAIAWPQPVRSHGSLTTTVLFDREIVRILNQHCVMCHMENGLSFPLETYEQTWLQGRAMRASVLRRHMPPWPAVAGYGEFINDNHLTLRESQFVVSWVEGLGPRNGGKVFLNVVDPKAAATREVRATPHTDHWQLGEPDLKRPLPPQTIDAQAGDSTKRLVIDLGLTAVRQVRGLEFMPGDRRVVRAATFSLEGTGQWLGSWTPWHGFVRLPDGVAYRLPARSRIVADIHYRGTREQATDRSTIGLFFAAAPAARAPTDLVLDARPAAEPGSSTATVKLSSETRVWAVQPDIAAGLTTLEVSTRRPDGGTDVLLALTAPSAEWPTPYLLKTPRLLSRGTEVFLVARSSTTQPRQVRVRLSRY